jgi:hypothetical protein
VQEKEKRPASSWLTNVVGLGFVMLLLLAVTMPVALLIDMVQYNPEIGLPVLAIGSGVIWFVTWLHGRYFDRNSAEAAARRATAKTIFGRIDWWSLIGKISSVFGIVTGIGWVVEKFY